MVCENHAHLPATPQAPRKERFREYRIIQDLRVTNEALVSLQPVVPNPLMILGETPPEKEWFSHLDLKDAFFCIPLGPSSQFLFPLNGTAVGIINSSLALPSHKGLETAHTSLVRL